MARHTQRNDDWDELADDDDYTMPCPHCKRPIHEDAERCPYCEQYISAEDAPSPHKPWWIVLGVLLCFIILYLWIAN